VSIRPPGRAVLTAWMLLCAVSATSARTQWQDTYVKMSIAQAKWLVARPAAYDFTISVRCHCSGLAKTPPTFHVEGTLSTPATPLTPQERETYARFDTVEDLFDVLRHAVSTANWTPFKFDVKYDPQLSFPVHAEVDPSSSASDDDVAFDVTDVKFVKK